MTSDGLRHPVSVRVIYDDHGRHVDGGVPAKPGAARDGSTRLMLVGGLFAVAFAVLVGRLAMVSFGMGAEPVIMAADEASTTRPVVYDRNGRPLILNRTAIGIAINGRDVWDVNEAVIRLTQLFPDADAGRLRQRLSDRQYTLVAQSISPAQQQAVIELGLPGISFPDTQERAYPQKDLAAHVVGYTIPGRGGATGAERALDDQAIGLSNGEVRLAIDLVAQQVLEDELAAAIQAFNAEAAWGVLIHARTGEVRALASLPDYNPNLPGAASDSAWRNRAMSDVYEIGSAFKPLTVAMALEHDVVNLTETFDVSRPIEVGGWTIKDYSVKTFPLSVSEIIQYSSNIGTIKIVQRMGRDRFVAGLASLGLTTPLFTELPESRAPLVPSAWREAEVATASYGHGIAVSPLQMAAAFAATINGGIYYQPTFVPNKGAAGHRVFSEKTSAQMRIILRKAVSEGTGRNAEADGYYVIGKTATADKPEVGGYRDDGELVSSFIGAFPGYDPEYVLLVSIDEPEGTKQTYGYATAGYVAAPVFRRVVERVAPPLGLLPVGDDVAFDGFVGMRRETAEASPEPQLISPYTEIQGAN